MLDSLDSQSIRLEGLVVIDNAPSLRDTSDRDRRISQHSGRVRRCQGESRAGGGIALGMERVLSTADDGDWIVLLDDDDPPPRVRSLAELKEMGDELLARDPRIAGIGLATARFDRRTGRLLLVPESERASGTPIRGDYIGGNRLPIYRVAAIRDVGVFDAKLFFGFEELEFGLRLRRAGYSLYEYRSPGHRKWAESARAYG